MGKLQKRKGTWEGKEALPAFRSSRDPCAAKNAAKKRLVTKGVLSVNTWLFGVFVYQYTIYTVWLSS